jgi:hypothetical protein
MKAIRQAQTRDILDAYNREDISYSRMNEMFNELAEEFAIGFAEWLYRYDNTRLPNGNWIIKLGLKPYTSEEVLEIYKKEL